MRIRRIVIPCILALAVLLSCRGEKNTPPETERVESAPESGTAETNEDAYRTIPTADTLGYTVSLLPPYDTDTDFAPRDPEDSATIVSFYHTATRENAFASAGFLFSIVREPEPKPDLTGGVRYFAKDESHYYAVLTPTDVRVDPSDPHFDAYTERALAMNTFLEQFIADNGLTPYSLAEDTAANTARIPDTTEDGRALRFAAAYGTGCITAPGHEDGSFTVPPTKKPAAREYVFEILDADGTPSGEYVTYMVQNDYRVPTQCGEIATKTTFVMENYGEPYTHSIAGFQSAACRYDPAADRTYRYAVGLSQHDDRLGMEYSVPGGITVIRECAEDGERVVYYGDYTCADGTFTAALTPYKDGVPSGEVRHVSGRIYLYEGYYALVSEEEGLPRLFMPYPETERTSFSAEYGPDIDAADLALAEKHAKSGWGVVYTGYELTCVTEDPYQPGSVYESWLRLPQLAYDTPEAQAWNEKIRNLYFTKHGAYIREAEQTGRGNIAFWVDYELSRTEIIENRVVEHIYTIVVRDKSSLLGTCATSDSISVTHFSANSGAFLTDEAFLAKTASVYGGLTVEALCDRANRQSFVVSLYGETCLVTPRDVAGVVPSRIAEGGLDLCYHSFHGVQRDYAADYPRQTMDDGVTLTCLLHYDTYGKGYRLRTNREVSYDTAPLVYSLSSVTCDTRTDRFGFTEVGLTVTGKTSFGDTLFLPYAKNPDLQTILRWYSDGYYTPAALFSEATVYIYARELMRTLLRAYRDGEDVRQLLPDADPATPAAFPDGETMPELDRLWFSDCYVPGPYRGLGIGHLRVPLESGSCLVFPLSVDELSADGLSADDGGDGFALYADGIFYENARTPDGEDVIARGYDTEAGREIVLSTSGAYVSENDGAYRKIDAKLPTEYADLRFTGTDGARIVLAGAEKSGKTSILTMDTAGNCARVTDVDTVLSLYLAGCELPFPNAVLPQSTAADFSLADRYGADTVVYTLAGKMELAAPFADRTALYDAFALSHDDTPSGSLLDYAASLLRRDVTALEENAYTYGLYAPLSGIRFTRAVLYNLPDDPENATLALPHVPRLCYTIDRSPFDRNTALGVGTHFTCITEGLGFYFLSDAENSPVTPAQQAVEEWLRTAYTPQIPATDDMDEAIRWSVTEYICMRLDQSTGKTAYTAAEITAYAKSHLGMDAFTPEEQSHTAMTGDGTYTSLPHGGTRYARRFLSDTEQDGIHAVTVQFYADLSCLVESDTYVYRLTEQSDGTWAFVGCERVAETGRGTYSYTM